MFSGDVILGQYFLMILIHNIRTLEVEHCLETCQRSWFTQILISRGQKFKMKQFENLFSSQNIAISSQNSVAEDMKKTYDNNLLNLCITTMYVWSHYS